MKRAFSLAFAALGLMAVLASAQAPGESFDWRYYRVGNTGLQGDYNEALWIAPDGDPFIAGYDPFFEEGGFARFVQAENRWVNYSNVDYPLIGHPDDQGCVRVQDIVADPAGLLWMGTWTGALTFDPALGASSLARLDAGNSPLVGHTSDIDVAPDGRLWFVSGGLHRYDPVAAAWTSWQGGQVYLSVQPKVGGGYFVWSADRYFGSVFRFDSATGQWTNWMPTLPGQVAGMPGKDCVDEAGNFWAFRLAATPGDWETLAYRRPDGTWVTPPPPYPAVSFYTWAFKAYGNGRALLADEQGTVWQFDGSAWASLGKWKDGPYTSALDIDAAGNVWVSGVGGAARRDALTGTWQRFRITNTGNFDDFNRDLTLDAADGGVYTTANAGGGVGGMVRFDGTRWTGWNQLTYGLGHDWPFPNDNCDALAWRPSSGHVAVSPSWLYGLHEWTGSAFSMLKPTGGAVRMCEDSLGRLWALGEYYSLQYLEAGTWKQVPIVAWGAGLQPDPVLPGTVWAHTGHQFLRTDGVTSFAREIGDFPELTTQSDTFSGVALAPDGTAWVGCSVQLGAGGLGGGLIHIDPDTGAYQMLTYEAGWPFPGNTVMPWAVTTDGRLWMQYDDTIWPYTERGLCWWDGTNVGAFPAPPEGGPQWGGLPHAGIADLEVRPLADGYELWMSCVSRGLAVLKVSGAGGPTWSDLGFGLAGTHGIPSLAGAGTLAAGTAGSLMLSDALALAPALLFVALDSQPVPWKGGVLVAYPPVIAPLLGTDAAGAISVPFTFPAGVPAGSTLHFQVALADGAAIKGVALSNALKAATP